jgi:hypothetical protein
MTTFYQHYQDYDLLMIDGLEAIAYDDVAQNVALRLFDAVQKHNGQIIATTRVPTHRFPVMESLPVFSHSLIRQGDVVARVYIPWIKHKRFEIALHAFLEMALFFQHVPEVKPGYRIVRVNFNRSTITFLRFLEVPLVKKDCPHINQRGGKGGILNQRFPIEGNGSFFLLYLFGVARLREKKHGSRACLGLSTRELIQVVRRPLIGIGHTPSSFSVGMVTDLIIASRIRDIHIPSTIRPGVRGRAIFKNHIQRRTLFL